MVPNAPLTDDVRAQLRSLVRQRLEEERRWMAHAKLQPRADRSGEGVTTSEGCW
jgi:hypothetical protein